MAKVSFEYSSPMACIVFILPEIASATLPIATFKLLYAFPCLTKDALCINVLAFNKVIPMVNIFKIEFPSPNHLTIPVNASTQNLTVSPSASAEINFCQAFVKLFKEASNPSIALACILVAAPALFSDASTNSNALSQFCINEMKRDC